MPATTPPIRSTPPGHASEALDDLEELGDDAIIAQQTEAHALRPRAAVSEEARSVVITDPPRRRDTESGRGGTFPRSSAEATLVIRDRRALDEVRNEVVRRQALKERGSRALYRWGGLGLLAFVIGGLVAFLATDSGSDAARATANGRVEAGAPPQAGVAPAAKPELAVSPAKPAVRLEQLPVEPRH